MNRIAVILPLILLTPGGCRKSGDSTTLPKREAYVRVNTYPSEYKPTDVPMPFDVNAGADASVSRRSDGSYWLTAVYPRYGATLYCTFTPVDGEKTTADAVDNRLERMHLNIADAPISTEQYAGNSYSYTLIKTRSMNATPLQFLVYPNSDRGGWVVSGAAFFPGLHAGCSLDSIRPIVEAVEADIHHSIYKLTCEQ